MEFGLALIPTTLCAPRSVRRRIPATPPLLLSSPVPHRRAAAPSLLLSSPFALPRSLLELSSQHGVAHIFTTTRESGLPRSPLVPLGEVRSVREGASSPHHTIPTLRRGVPAAR